MAVEFRVLGPLELLRDGHAIGVSSAKQRLLLAVLLAHPNDVVSVDALVEGLWSTSAPSTAVAVVRSYVSQLRKVLETPGTTPAEAQVLQGAEGGYRLVVEPGLFDAAQFERLDRAGRAALDEGEPADALELLGAALALWRGRAFGELAHEVAIRPVAQRLEELHTLTIEHRTDAAMALGRHREVIGELEEVLSEYPLRERQWAQLMVCLYRSGRQAEALGAYQRLRRHLGEELGLEPSVELRRLESDILQQDPQLDWIAPTAAGEIATRAHVGTDSAHSVLGRRADPLATQLPAPRTLDESPGNLTAPPTSFLGRALEVKLVKEMVRTQRLVTLTGVGGVGKTRLALQVGAELAGEFPDGVWLVELAPIGDPASVPDAVTAALRLSPRAGGTAAQHIAHALGERRMLLVLDNCEHVLDAAADLVDAILTASATLKVLASSREGLRLAGEQLWSVPTLAVDAGERSTAVQLFVERARAVLADFDLGDQTQSDAVVGICQRLDGIPLAIELAAARIVSLSPQEIQDHLDDRFRLLGGGPRGATLRHQTLQNVVQWSFDLLNTDERSLLIRASVFADGFDLQAATHVCGEPLPDVDDLVVLDRLESLIRKSLITVDRSGRRVRYRMLDTIRLFGEQALVALDPTREISKGHAAYFAQQAVAHWELWDGPNQRVALDWVDVEFANLRVAFRRAADEGALATAAAIAAHTTMLGFALHRFESIGWAEEILPAVRTANLAELPRVYTAASVCSYTGRPQVGLRYAQAALALGADPHYRPFLNGWSEFWEVAGYLYCGRFEEALAVVSRLAGQPGSAHVYARCARTQLLGLAGRDEEAIDTLDATLAAARAHGNPFFVTWAHYACGVACARSDPARALHALSQGLDYARDHRLPLWQVNIARQAARVESVQGDLEQALTLYDSTINSCHLAGNVVQLAIALAQLVALFDRAQRPEIAATVYGTIAHDLSINLVFELPAVVARLRAVLGDTTFDDCAAAGAAMELADAVRYAREQIQLERTHRSAGRRGAAPRS